MSKQKKKKKLNDFDNVKIGDTVLLYYNAKVDDKDSRKDGYVMTDLSGSNPQQLVLVKPSKKDFPELPDIKLGTFKIVSANNYDAQSRFREQNSILAELQKKCEELYENYYKLYFEDGIDGDSTNGADSIDGNSTDQGMEQKDILELIEKEIEEAELEIEEAQSEVERTKAHVQVEKEENEAKQRQLRGNNIWYGQRIQLLHTLTGKYLCVSTTESSRTENSKLKVYLQRKDSVGCIFRLHPHIKVESVGEEINFYDQIKFESLAVEGQYLHCSKKTFSKLNITANSECFELNISAKDSPLQIVPHYKTSKEVQESDSILRASGVVRFFNHKHQSYIVGEGSFAGKNCNLQETKVEPKATDTQSEATKEEVDDEFKEKVAKDDTDSAPSKNVPKVGEKNEANENAKEANEDSTEPALLVDKDDDVILNDVHFRRKRTKLGLGNPPSTSPNTFWQIEKCSMPSSGEPITWKEECRMKHLPTRRYLAVIKDPKDGYMVTLKSSKLKAETIFQLFPVVYTPKVDGKIDFESYVRVQHKRTGTWLHFDKDKKYNSEDKDGDNFFSSDDGESRELFKVIILT